MSKVKRICGIKNEEPQIKEDTNDKLIRVDRKQQKFVIFYMLIKQVLLNWRTHALTIKDINFLHPGDQSWSNISA